MSRVWRCLHKHWWAPLVALAVVAVVAFGVWSAFGLVQTRKDQAAATAERVRESRKSRFTLCQDNNQTRAGIREYLLNSFPNPDDPRLTPAQRDYFRARLAYGEALFADRNCEDVVAGKPPPPLPPAPTIPMPTN